MNKYAVASLLMLPAFAPPLAAQTLLVEYEGIVSQVENPQFAPDLNYAVGDRVKGTLEMDAAPEGGPITDDDLRQSFEAIPEKDGSVLSGLIQRVRGGINRFTTTVRLSLSRMEVCSI